MIMLDLCISVADLDKETEDDLGVSTFYLTALSRALFREHRYLRCAKIGSTALYQALLREITSVQISRVEYIQLDTGFYRGCCLHNSTYCCFYYRLTVVDF